MSHPVLKIHDSRADRKSDCTIRKPQKLGGYSVTKKADGDVYEEGENELRILKLPAKLKHVSYDLTDGYVRMRDGGTVICGKVNQETGLKNLLQWVLKNKDKFKLQSDCQSSCVLNTDFLTYRGVLSKIMIAPYENRDGWCIGATKYKGTIYLYEFLTDKKRDEELNRNERVNMLSYGGFRFEHYVTEPVDPEADDELDFQRHNEYCCVARTRLGHHSLVYGAEMDCVSSRRHAADPQLENFMEIKTTRVVDNQRQWDNLVKFKMFKWWAQCYLIGTPTLVCGYRDDDLTVREIEILNVSEMPKMAGKFWSPAVCLRFLNRFLDFVKQVVVDDDPEVIFEFEWEPNRDITVRKTRVTPDRYVMPQSYINAL